MEINAADFIDIDEIEKKMQASLDRMMDDFEQKFIEKERKMAEEQEIKDAKRLAEKNE